MASPPPPLYKVIAYYCSVKGVMLALTTITVIGAHLSVFVSGLIIAAVSATIGAVGMILAAYVSARQVRQHVVPKVQDIAHKVEADRREHDEFSSEN